MSMNYHNLYHKMWTDKNGTFRQILDQHGRDAAFLALYLMTSSHAEQSGIYHCPIAYMAHDTGIPQDQIEEHLSCLHALGFCKYDYEADVVWVIKMAKYQVKGFPNGKDNQVKGVLNKLDTVPATYLLDEFRDLWGIPPDETSPHLQVIQKPLGSPSEALDKLLARAPLSVCTVEEGVEASSDGGDGCDDRHLDGGSKK